MSITDELREWAVNHRAELDMGQLYPAMIEGIADRIDAEHKRLMQEQPFTIDMVPITDENMAKHGWVRLPVDTDGVPWHIGDRTESGQTIEAMGLNRHGWHFVGTFSNIDPAIHHHRYVPTVEDVMVEFATDWESTQDGEDKTAVLKEFAAKLQLKEDA